MMTLLNDIRSFYKLESDTLSDKLIEILVKFWITVLATLAVGGWFTILINWILNPNMWDNVTFGLIDYIP